MFLTRVCKALTDHAVPFAIVGGHAVALHGAVRGTVDIDFVIQWSQENLDRAETAITELGLVSRLPVSAKEVFSNRDDYIEKRNLIAWNFFNPERLDEQINLIINYDLARQTPKFIHVGDANIPVLDVKELIAMKKKSGRQQDLFDAEALEKLHP